MLKTEDELQADLYKTLQAMQMFNHKYRFNDTRALFGIMKDIFDFEIKSEGTTLWLSLILAIKELYGFSQKKLIDVMKQVTIRK